MTQGLSSWLAMAGNFSWATQETSNATGLQGAPTQAENRVALPLSELTGFWNATANMTGLYAVPESAENRTARPLTYNLGNATENTTGPHNFATSSANLTVWPGWSFTGNVTANATDLHREDIRGANRTAWPGMDGFRNTTTNGINATGMDGGAGHWSAPNGVIGNFTVPHSTVGNLSGPQNSTGTFRNTTADILRPGNCSEPLNFTGNLTLPHNFTSKVLNTIALPAYLRNWTAPYNVTGNLTVQQGNASKLVNTTTDLPYLQNWTMPFNIAKHFTVQHRNTSQLMGYNTSSLNISSHYSNYTHYNRTPGIFFPYYQYFRRPHRRLYYMPTECIDDFGYFEFTDDNIVESNVIVWYQTWTTKAAQRYPSEWANYGEVRLFGITFLKDDDYNCGLGLGGCTRRPSCNSILRLYPYDPALARRIYFVMKMHGNISLMMKTLYDATLAAHLTVRPLIPRIITSFTQQVDPAALDRCNWIRSTASNLFGIVQNIATPWVQNHVNDYIKKICTYEVLDTNALLWVKERAFTIFNGWFSKEGLTAPHGPGDISFMCQGIGYITPNNEGHTQDMQTWFMRKGMRQRDLMSANTKALFKGTFGEGMFGSQLANLIGSRIWADDVGLADALMDPFRVEKAMVHQMTEGLVSKAYQDSTCFMKCATTPHAQKMCEGFNHWEFGGKEGDARDPQAKPQSKYAAEQAASRICPAPNKVCQIECWSQERKGFSQKLHGQDKVQREPYNVDLKEAMFVLYEWYKKHGNKKPIEEYEASPESVQGTEIVPYFWLPVCDSDMGYVHLVDFQNQELNKAEKANFPLSCGSFRSEETPRFLHALNMGHYPTNFDPGFRVDKLYQNLAPKALNAIITAPLDNFLALCAMGIAFPERGHKHPFKGTWYTRRSSRFCRPIAEETRDMPGRLRISTSVKSRDLRSSCSRTKARGGSGDTVPAPGATQRCAAPGFSSKRHDFSA
jgi:hypothetical protein